MNPIECFPSEAAIGAHALSKIEARLVSAPGALGSLLFNPMPHPTWVGEQLLLKVPFKSIEQIEHSARFFHC